MYTCICTDWQQTERRYSPTGNDGIHPNGVWSSTFLFLKKDLRTESLVLGGNSFCLSDLRSDWT